MEEEEFGFIALVVAAMILIAVLLFVWNMPQTSPCDLHQPSVNDMQHCYATQTAEAHTK